MIDNERLIKNLEEINVFGALKGGGLNRIAFTNDERDARKYLFNILNKRNFKIRQDEIGNIIARIDGEDPYAKAVTAGSHLDSVPFGGCYDGTLGVICALEAITSIKESGKKFKRPLELIVFSCEESSRFKMATVGSKVMCSKLSLDKLKQLKDKDGISIYEAAKKFGCKINNLKQTQLPDDTFYSYLELHIEQGPVLESKKIPIGVVLAIAAPIRYELKLLGRADHSGATPMYMRKDALLCASKIITKINKIASQEKTAVATVGYAKAKPGVMNVIPGELTMGIDIRDIDKEILLSVDEKIRKLIKKITKKDKIKYELKRLTKDIPITLDEYMIKKIVKNANKLNIKNIKLPSGAGHDAMHMKKVASHVGMIFVPCKKGISHNVKEKIVYKDIFKATEVMSQVLLELAND